MGLRKIKKTEEDIEFATREAKETLAMLVALWRDKAKTYERQNQAYRKEIEALKRQVEARRLAEESQDQNQDLPVAF